MKVAVLARHGQTIWHSPNRYTGSSDVPLDDTGQEQARLLAAWAAEQKFVLVASSDLRRAVTTALPTAAALGLSATVDERLRELDFGTAEGLTLEQIRATDRAVAERFTEDPVAGHFPGGEHPATALARFRAGLAAVAAVAGAGTALIVAHSTIIRLVVCDAVGIPLADYRRRLPALRPTGITTLRLNDAGQPVALLAYNAPVP